MIIAVVVRSLSDCIDFILLPRNFLKYNNVINNYIRRKCALGRCEFSKKPREVVMRAHNI